jgi:hypothetical protein
MSQSKMALTALLRGLARHGECIQGTPAALVSGFRCIGTSVTGMHVQPVPAEDVSGAQAENPRWQRELGIIRTDWT